MNTFHMARSFFLFVWVPVITLLSSLVAIAFSVFDRTGNPAHLVGRLWSKLVLWAAGVSVTVRGLEHITDGRPRIYAANHQSQLDIPAVLGHLPIQFRWLAKKGLFQIPIFGFAMRRAGYLPVDRSHPREAIRSLEMAARKISEGTSVLIFPEGTRSYDGRLLPFKTGGMVLALKSGCPIVPLAILGSRDCLPRGSLWVRPGRIEIRIGPEIGTAGLKPGQKDVLATKVRGAISLLMEEESNNPS